jgi:hypothetical protein
MVGASEREFHLAQGRPDEALAEFKAGEINNPAAAVKR